MKPAARLILSLARGEMAGVRTCLKGCMDWDMFRELARRHQVDALCYLAWRGLLSCDRTQASAVAAPLDERSRPALPGDMVTDLRAAYAHHALRHQILDMELTAVHTVLCDAGIAHLFLKGPWLVFKAYPSPASRPVGDIDLCIAEADFEAAVGALEDMGYVPRNRFPRHGAAALKHAHHAGQLRLKREGGYLLEMHFRVVNIGPPSMDEGWIWESQRTVDLPGGAAIPVPGPEAMLLHLLLHANQHGFAILRLLHDVRFCLDQDRSVLRLDRFIGAVSQLGIRRLTYHALCLAVEMAGADPPAGLISVLRPSPARRRWFSLCWRLDRVRRLEARRWPVFLEAPLLYLLEFGGTWRKLRYVFDVLALGLLSHLRKGLSRLQRAAGGMAPGQST